MEHYDIYCDWLRSRRFGAFDYQGHHRVVVPGHVGQIGGDDVLVAYQIDGSSSSGVPPFWRTFKLNQIRNLQMSERSFVGFPNGFRRNAGRMNMRVCCELSDC